MEGPLSPEQRPPPLLLLSLAAFFARVNALDPELLELHVGLCSFGWGAWMIATSLHGTASSTFRALAVVAPGWAWGLVATSLGAVKLAGVWGATRWLFGVPAEDRVRRLLALRRGSALCGAAFWSCVSMGIWLGDRYAPSLPLYLTLVFSSLLIHVRHRPAAGCWAVGAKE